MSIIWGNADSAKPDDLDPLQYGWKVENRHYMPKWFPGSAVPDNLFQDVSVTENTEGNDHTEQVEDTLVDTSSGPERSDDSDSEDEL